MNIDFLLETINHTYDLYVNVNRDFLSKSDYNYSFDLLQLSEASRNLALAFLGVQDLPDELEKWRPMFAQVWKRLERDLRNADIYSQKRIRLNIVRQTMEFFNDFEADFEDFHYSKDMEKSIRYFNITGNDYAGVTKRNREVILGQEYEIGIKQFENVFFYFPLSRKVSTIPITEEYLEKAKHYSDVRSLYDDLVFKNKYIRMMKARIKRMGVFIRLLLIREWFRSL